MKKVLFATTALGLLAAGSALAEGPVVTLGGYADFQVGNADQDSSYSSPTSGIYSRDTHTRTDTQISVKVDGKADNGLGYGAYIELNADVSQEDGSAEDSNARETYIYVESGFGRVEAGATGDAGNALKVDASNFARATGGIAGDFYKYVDLSDNGATTGNYYVLPGLPTAVGLPGEATGSAAALGVYGDIHNDRATANKVSYYSPRIQGLQLGVSFTPDQDERGTAYGFSGDDSSLENVWNAGLNYAGQYNSFGVAAAVTGEWGDAQNTTTGAASTLGDLEAYQAGLNLSYAGFTVGGSYAIIDELPNLFSTPVSSTEADVWTVGGAYEFGPFATSVTYLESTVDAGAASAADSEFNNLSIGADYKLAPGLMPYVEVSFFETDDNTAGTVDNDGTVFLVGTELSF